jgi:hypothetical protein
MGKTSSMPHTSKDSGREWAQAALDSDAPAPGKAKEPEGDKPQTEPERDRT